MMTDLNMYRAFYTIIKCGSISKAAKELGLSQPTVSRMVTALEKELGMEVFARNSRGVLLTEAGNALYRILEPTFLNLTQTERTIEHLVSRDISVIQIGTNMYSSDFFLQKVNEKFREMYPGVMIYTNKMPSAYAIEAINSGWIDIFFSYFLTSPFQIYDTSVAKLYHDKTFERIELARPKDSLIVGPAYKEYPPEKMGNIPLIMHKMGFDNKRYYLQHFRRNTAPGKFDIEIDDTKSRIWLAKYNHGMSYCPEIFIRRELQEKELFTLESGFDMCGYVASWYIKKDHMGSPIMQELIRCSQEFFEEQQ